MHAHLKVAMRHTVTKKYEKKSTTGIEKSFSMIDRIANHINQPNICYNPPQSQEEILQLSIFTKSLEDVVPD